MRLILASYPSDSEALFVLASALQLQGRAAEATAILADHTRKRAALDRVNDLLKNAADRPTVKADDYAEIGRLFLEMGRDRLGVYWSQRALEYDPDNQQAHRALAVHFEAKGDAARAATHRQQIREVPPTPKTPKPEGKAP